MYILYVIASLCLCNCLCLCTFFLCFRALYQPQCVCVYPFTCCCTYILYEKIFCACVIAYVCVPVFVPSTTLHVFVYTPSQMVALWCPVNTRALDCRFFSPFGYKCRSRRRQNTVSTVACCHAHTRPLHVSAML